jgi:hypothetical protein
LTPALSLVNHFKTVFMPKISHQDFIEKLKDTETLSLLYCIVEAKTGQHIDIVSQVPLEVIQEAEGALRQLVSFSRTALNAHS